MSLPHNHDHNHTNDSHAHSKGESGHEVDEHEKKRVPWYKDGTSLRVLAVIFLTGIFFLVELVVGIITHSVALLSDAVHMLSDLLSQIIGFAFVQISYKDKSNKMSYGWARSEVLGGLINSSLLIMMAGLILMEALHRFFGDPEVKNVVLLMIVAALGLVVNILGIAIMSCGGEDAHAHHHHHHGHSHGHSHTHSHEEEEEHSHSHEHDHNHDHNADSSPENSAQEPSASSAEMPISEPHFESEARAAPKKKKKMNMNIQGMFLHLIGDALGSVGVLISAAIIQWGTFSWRFYFDPICSLLVCFLILRGAIPLVIETTRILLLATPSHIDQSKLLKSIKSCPGVAAVHNLHIWEIISGKNVASLHLVVKSGYDFVTLVVKVKEILHRYEIHYSTIQPEFEQEDINCVVSCSSRNCSEADDSYSKEKEESVIRKRNRKAQEREIEMTSKERE